MTSGRPSPRFALAALLLGLHPAAGTAQDSAASDERALRAAHETILRAHRENDLPAWTSLEADAYVEVNGGRVTFPIREERRARRAPYLRETRFTRYEDLREPIVEVSDDGTVGWVIARVAARGTRTAADGTRDPVEFVAAWVELYRKIDGRWRLVGNVSNLASPEADEAADERSAGQRLAESRRLQRESILAYRAGDITAFRVKNDSALALRPDHPSLVYNGAAAAALAGDSAAALRLLGRLAEWGLAYDPGQDDDFAALRDVPEFAAVRQRLLGNRAPRGRAASAFRLPEREMIAEGLAYDPGSRSFVVTDVRHRSAWRLGRNGASPSRLVDAADGAPSPLGLAIDPARRALWISGTRVPESIVTPGDSSSAEPQVREYDLDSGALRRVLLLPGRDAGGDSVGPAPAAGDVAVEPGGTVLVSDWRTGALFRGVAGADMLVEVLPPGSLGSPQGIFPLPDGSGAWVADYALGLAFVDFGDGSVDVARTRTTLLGADAVAADGRRLLVVQNGVAPARLLQVDLSADPRRIENVEVLLAAHPDFGGPTGLTVVDGVPYLIADGQWERFADGAPDPQELEPPEVLRVGP